MTARPLPDGRAIRTLLTAVGALASAQAVLWHRAVAEGNAYRPAALALAVAASLAGFAVGLLSTSGRTAPGALRRAGALVATAGLLQFLALPASAWLLTRSVEAGRIALVIAAASTAVCAGRAARRLSAVGPTTPAASPEAVADALGAVAVGAALGGALTRYVLLDVETLERAVLAVTFASVGAGQLFWWLSSGPRRVGLTVLSLLALMALVTHGACYAHLLERLHFGLGSREVAYRTVVQGRDGIVGVTADGQAYSDGLYQDAYSLDAESNSNLISRAYFVPALHRAPRHILQLGFGTGTWTRVLADTRGVDSLTVIEPNAAVLETVWRHPEIASVLDDPRVRLYAEPARRWLARHPDARFDVVIVSAPWHWRQGATHQLSAEFLRVVKAHLAPGGVAYVAATGSLDVLYTMAGVWRHVMRVSNSVAASDAPFDQSRDERRAALLQVVGADGQPRIRGAGASATLEAILNSASGELAPALRRANDLWNVTDDNMATEFKASGAGAWWRALPARVWRPDRAWPTVLF